jgi:quercetin 2,3-dioxygenase
MSPIKRVFKLGMPWQTLDPFLFCVYHKDDYPKSNGHYGPADSLEGRQIGQDFQAKDGWNMYHGQRVPGFPAHPHRGFETITVVNQGIVDHADSNGAAGRYGGGDTQWMTAGKGLQHSEMFPLLKADQDNPLVLFQIWINLPAKNKLVEPGFTMLWREDIPKVEVKDANNRVSRIQVVAGEYAGQRPPSPPKDSWASEADNHVWLWNIKMQAGASWQLPASVTDINRTLYFYHGEQALIEDENILPKHGVVLTSDKAVTITAGNTPCEFILMQGRPINEPVSQYGPFVMNTQQEIQAAFDDYRRTQFGGWPWPSNEPVHEQADTRFARYTSDDMIKKNSL